MSSVRMPQKNLHNEGGVQSMEENNVENSTLDFLLHIWGLIIQLPVDRKFRAPQSFFMTGVFKHVSKTNLLFIE